MPTVSEKQRRFFALCKHSPQHARGKCPPVKVTSEYLAADKAKDDDEATTRRMALK